MYVPPRALLFVPAHRDRFREKAIGVDVDALILDLEDAVPLAEKEGARDKAGEFVTAAPDRAFVRINPVRAATRFAVACGEEDLAAIVRRGLKGILLPKVERREDLLEADALLRAFERCAGMARGSTVLLGLVETARGIQAAGEIAAAQMERPLCLSFGAGDFTGDLGIEWTSAEEECRHARSALVIACRAGRLPRPIDSVFADVRDSDGLRANTLAAKAMGFQSKMVIHPDQVAVVQEIFTPQAEERDWAERVLAGMREAEARGEGAFTIDGKLVDYALLERAHAIQQRCAALGI